MSKKFLIFGLIFLICLAGCSQEQDTRDNDNKPTVKVEKVKESKAALVKTYDTILELDDEQFICAEVSGYVRNLYYKEGDKVDKGNQLALIESQAVSLSAERSVQEVQVAQAQYEKLEARLNEAQNDMGRQKKLFASGAISQAQMDKYELELDLLAKDLEQSQSQLELALIKQKESSLNSSKCEIIAQDTLWLTEKMATAGQFINAGEPIFKAGKCNNLIMYIAVPVKEANIWQEGDVLEVDHQGELREANIVNINAIQERGTERVKVKIRVNNSDLRWLPGSLAKVKYSLEGQEQVLVPVEAIVRGDSTYVYVLKDGRACRQEVVLESAEGPRVAVSGLKEGDIVVTGGVHRLRDGIKVTVKEGN